MNMTIKKVSGSIHLILLAKDAIGHHQFQISTRAWGRLH